MIILSLVIFVLKGDIKGITSTMSFSAEHSIELINWFSWNYGGMVWNDENM